MMTTAEILYGTQEDPLVMSERVQSLAGCIYREFEEMICAYGDNVIKGLMPHIVSVLENLNQAYREKQDHEVDNELLKVENDNLRKQFEKEKQLRKNSEQKYLEGDDLLEEEKKLHQQTVEVIESNLRRLEVKVKNLQEQILRNEDREAEMKTEYSKLHSRYTEILKKHADYVERYIIQNEKEFVSPNRSSSHLPVLLRHVSNSAVNKEMIMRQDLTVDLHQADDAEGGDQDLNNALKNEINNEKNRNDSSMTEESLENLPEGCNKMAEKTSDIQESIPKLDEVNEKIILSEEDSANSLSEDGLNGREGGDVSAKDVADGSSRGASHWVADEVGDEWVPEESQDAGVDECLLATYRGNILSLTSVEYDESAEPFRDDDPSNQYPSFGGKLEKASSIFDELSRQDSKALGEIDGGINLAVEVETLIKENNELLETKNALNIVKDDLITRVDELSGEQELLQEELFLLQGARDKQLARVSELDEELKRTKEELDGFKEKALRDDEDDRKCFTRIDMTRVVMERNQFKEKLMELQEALRLAEMLRASKDHPDLIKTSKKKSSSFWSFFSGLVNGNDTPPKQNS